MSDVSVDKLIGKTLVATKDVIAHSGNPKATKAKTITAGSVIGLVYSWVKDPDNAANVYWVFHEKYGNALFFVKHDSSRLKLHPAEKVLTVEEELKAQKEKEDMEQKGKVVFYLEKYAPYIGGFIFITVAAKAYLGRNNK